jgi:transcriptional activator for dhaKLM operon
MFASKLRDRLFAWTRFVSQQAIHPTVDPLVANSWQRCSPRLNPHQTANFKKLNPEHLLATQAANFDLISIARPIMEDIHQFIEASTTLVMLVNRTGFVLECLGDDEMAEIATQHQIITGTSVSEGQIGTNAFALALTERVPARVVGPDHFLQQFHKLADAAAPIFDPSGRPLGALGVLTEAQKYHPHTLGLIVAGARAIEGQWQSDLLLQEQIKQLGELNAILASVSDGIMVWNSEEILLHANTAASDILGVPAATLVGRKVEDNISFPDFIRDALADRQTITNAEANITINGHTARCVVSLRFAGHPSGTQWVILSLRRTEEVRQMIHHQTGPQVAVSIDDFAGRSREIERMRYLARTAAPARASILIRGESGAGKDFLARALHNAGPRRKGPFVIFGCSSVPNELVMEELLGFEQRYESQGAGGRPSKFELAQGGTLFFQNVDVLPFEAQALLLNVLELGLAQRLGSAHPVEVDVRIIASTTADLENLIKDGQFRADLYYRLSTFEIEMPPLRTRRTDLQFLVDRILERLSRQQNHTLALAPGVLNLLTRYHWPGNVRELEALLERAAIQVGKSEQINETHLPEFIRHPANLPTQTERLTHLSSFDHVQREALIQAARICNGNITQMAKVLGIGRTTVWRKLKALDISAEVYRRRST